MKYVFTRNTKSLLNPFIKISQYLLRDALPCIILVIEWEIDLTEKFNQNLGYILTIISDLDN